MAGSITVTNADAGSGVTKYSIAWTSDASGAVSGDNFEIRRGRLLQAKFVPGTTTAQPTDLYDVVVRDADGADVLQGQGANLSNSIPSYVSAAWGSGAPLYLEGQALYPVVAGAGNAKSGTIILFVGP